MRGVTGYITVAAPEKPLLEQGAAQCPHCTGIITVEARPNAQSEPEIGTRWCSQCHQHICRGCAQHATCRPFEKMLEAMERRRQLPGG